MVAKEAQYRHKRDLLLHQSSPEYYMYILHAGDALEGCINAWCTQYSIKRDLERGGEGGGGERARARARERDSRAALLNEKQAVCVTLSLTRTHNCAHTHW